MKVISLSLSLMCFTLFFCDNGWSLTEGAQSRIDKAAIDLGKISILDLKTAGSIALEKNPSLEAALLRVQQARERLSQARATLPLRSLSPCGGLVGSLLWMLVMGLELVGLMT